MKAVLAVAVLALLVGGCGGGDDEQLQVFAASSLRDVLPALDDAPRYEFGGSDDLARQIRDGAQADVFAAASPRFPDELARDGLAEEPRVFARNRLVIVVSRQASARLFSLDDLARPGTKVVIGDAGVPIGDYTRKVLERAGADGVLQNVVSFEDDVKGVLGKVALGEADAGFVYATDADTANGDVTVVELPSSVLPTVEYEVTVLKDAPHREAADRFVERLLGPEGRAALRRAGFAAP